mgnify:FL=1
MLGGVNIPHDRGLSGHSDADVLLHAVTDAVLGAVAAGDIGQWFPPSDPDFRGADRAELLAHVLNAPALQGWTLVNLDCTIVAEAPKLAPHIPSMRTRMADIFGVPGELVSVKATTTEGLGFTGRGEGIAAFAVVCLERRSNPAQQANLGNV